jgi:16S rRNA processing protein RimM
MAEKLVLVGQVGGAFGVRGEVKITAFTGDAMALVGYSPLLKADGSVGLTLTGARPDKKGVVARAREITTKEQADALRGTLLYADRDRLPTLPDDEFYHADLIGLEVVDTGGKGLGTIRAIHNHGAGDILEILGEGRRQPLLLPFTMAVVPTVDLAARRVVVDLPEGAE